MFGSGAYSSDGPHHQILSILGMKSAFDATIATERIQYYHTCDENDDEIFEKSCCLLSYLNGIEFNDEWLPLMRIPALNPVEGANEHIVLHPSKCRPKVSEPLVKGVLGIVPIHVEEFLCAKFGWKDDLEPHIISARIDYIIHSARSSSDVQLALYHVFDYLNNLSNPDRTSDYVTEINSILSEKSWLPGSSEGLWRADRIFIRDARGFEPYMSDIPITYSQNFTRILQLLNIAPVPTSGHILDFILSAGTEPLSGQRLDAVILGLKRLDSDFDASFIERLMVPDIHGILRPVADYFPDNHIDGATFPYAHPRVPPSLTFKCSIPQFENDLAQIQHMSGGDFFEEFCHEEDIVTRISTAIKESSQWASLNEFVANAEDCGTAKKAYWILDLQTSEFPTEDIFCKELVEWQTPALYFYNDGVFTDSDFEALVNVGMGSKSDDSSKIGKYGLGSLSMYLFTDLPSMISGEYFVIFDPTRKYLPYARGGRRRQAGMRLRLSHMRARFCGHLEPFVGIGEYQLGNINNRNC